MGTWRIDAGTRSVGSIGLLAFLQLGAVERAGEALEGCQWGRSSQVERFQLGFWWWLGERGGGGLGCSKSASATSTTTLAGLGRLGFGGGHRTRQRQTCDTTSGGRERKNPQPQPQPQPQPMVRVEPPKAVQPTKAAAPQPQPQPQPTLRVEPPNAVQPTKAAAQPAPAPEPEPQEAELSDDVDELLAQHQDLIDRLLSEVMPWGAFLCWIFSFGGLVCGDAFRVREIRVGLLVALLDLRCIEGVDFILCVCLAGDFGRSVQSASDVAGREHTGLCGGGRDFVF